MMSERGKGETCTYCKRTLDGVTARSRLAATRDHVVPRVRGGGKTVWCCRQCNNIKGDMMPDDWSAFMESYPEWWKHHLFSHYGSPEKKPRWSATEPAKPKRLPYQAVKAILLFGRGAAPTNGLVCPAMTACVDALLYARYRHTGCYGPQHDLDEIAARTKKLGVKNNNGQSVKGTP